jgi:hypothetical protein
MSETLRARFDYDVGDVHLRYPEGRRISPQAMVMWLEAIERHVPRSVLRAFSDLASISEEEFRRGMQELRRYCATAPHREIAVDVDLFVCRTPLRTSSLRTS